MSKYHKGDKFIVEIKEVIESDNGTLYRSNFKTLTFDDNGLDKLQKCETELSWDECYNKGLNDSWELAKKVALNCSEGGYKVSELKERFQVSSLQGVFKRYTPQEALAKFEAYEKEQNEIKAGDVVCVNGIECLVTSVFNNHINAIDSEGVVCGIAGKPKKTGKHIDIQSVLSQIAE